MSTSRFDPLDMALTALSPPSPPATGAPSSSSDASNSSVRRVTSNAASRRRTASEPQPRAASSRPAPTTSKRQLNIYLSADAASRLRHASIALGGQHSLGDIVEHLVNSHLEATVEQLGTTDPDQPTRLRAGRKLRGSV